MFRSFTSICSPASTRQEDTFVDVVVVAVFVVVIIIIIVVVVITSTKGGEKRGYVFGSVCLFVRLAVCRSIRLLNKLSVYFDEIFGRDGVAQVPSD